MGSDAARFWVDQLYYGGDDNWRLPSVNSSNVASLRYAYDGSCDGGYNNTIGELGHMFYNNLGNIGRNFQSNKVAIYRNTVGNSRVAKNNLFVASCK